LVRYGMECTEAKSGVILPATNLAGLTQHLNGFDEVWLFEKEIQGESVSALPADLCLNSASFVLERIQKPREKRRMWEAMTRTQCSLAMGDGCDLNYIMNSAKYQNLLKT